MADVDDRGEHGRALLLGCRNSVRFHDHRPRRVLARARAGVLSTAHGDVRTPAFTPLATKATVKGLLPEEVASLGYDMVLGNTFHLLLNPAPS